MSSERRQLPRGGSGLRGARRRQAPGDEPRPGDLPADRPHGGRALDASRGEPAFVFELGGRTLAFVVEGLGTKSIISRAVLETLGVNRFADVAYDTVAAIVNDLCCVGALPLVVNAYFATGSSDWYREAGRSRGARRGLAPGLLDAGCTWGGGESPSLPGLLAEGDVELAGAAVGAVPEGRGRSSARSSRRAMRSCSSRPAGCTPTAPRWRGWSRGGCPRATRRSCPAGPSFGEALLEPIGDLRAARRGPARAAACPSAT